MTDRAALLAPQQASTVNAASHYPFDRDQAAQQLDLMFANERGWLEIAYIDGPPDDPSKPKAQTEGWYPWPAMRETILDKIGELARAYGNVYTGVSLFDRSYHREKRYAKPGRVIFIDDALIDGCTFAVESSAGNHQSWFLLERPEDAATREQLARRAAYASGGDTGGWDCTQLARIAGTHNTKHKCGEPFPVRLVAGSGQCYSADALLARWPAAAPPRGSDDTELDWQHVALQRGNLDRLLNADRMPRRLKIGSFSWRVLRGDVTVPDRSLRRLMVCKGLVRVGYPNDEIAAILEELCDYGHSKEKGAQWLKNTIKGCITKSRADWARQNVTITVTPSHGGLTQPAAPVNDTPRKSRARKDRPQRITALDYYEDVCRLADAMGRVNATRAEQAQRYSVSVATIARIEHQLTEQGLLKRHTTRKRGGTTSCLEVSRINITSEAVPTVEQAAELVVSEAQPKTAEIAQQDAVNRENANAPLDGTHPPERSSDNFAPVGVRLADAMRAAIEAAAGAHGRVSKARARAVFGEFFAGLRWSDREYSRAMKRRAQETQLSRLVAWAQDAKTQPSDLKRKARSLAYQQRRAIEEGHSAKAYALGLQANAVEDEIELRILRGEIRKRVPKRTVIAAPQLDFEETAVGTPPRACVPSLRTVVLPKIEPRTAPSEPPAMVFDGRTVERLCELKRQREAANLGGTP